MPATNTILSEIDYDIPFGLPGDTYAEGKPLFTAFGCVLFEKETPKGYYSYRAYNLDTNRSARLDYREEPLEYERYTRLAEKMAALPIAGPSRLCVDKAPGGKMPRERLAAILERVFHELLPAHGYPLRQPQAELAASIFDSLCGRRVILAEAEVGIGKTLAYLVAAALMKRGRVNDFWFRGRFPGQSWADSAFLPVVVSTSSIALQNALVRDYVPALSRMLVEGGIIKEPLTCVLRKGREHYLCERRLRGYLADADEATAAILLPLLEKGASIDLADAVKLTPYMKRRICVSGRCDYNCAHRDTCRYRWHDKQIRSNKFDFQICNHQLLLADALHRRDKLPPLLPHYQAVVIDEGHKFLEAARQMYGLELAGMDILPVTEDIRTLSLKRTEDGAASKIWRDAKKLCGQGKRLAKLLEADMAVGDSEEETDRRPVQMDGDAPRHLRNIRRICDDLLAALPEQPVAARHKNRRAHILRELEGIRKRAVALEHHGSLICWAEKRSKNAVLCAIPKDLDVQLHKDFWGKGFPIVLTSGTLSAGGDFGRIRQTLGLHRLPPAHLREARYRSPFDHYANSMLYISERVPFPDNRNRAYILAVADEVERLVHVSHGHAAVLFTSYKLMDIIREQLEERRLPFPLFQMHRGSTIALERFKRSGNGILLASGALWEGIDIPGDTLSLLIIVRLPFAAPDPISAYEQSLYPDFATFKDMVVTPDMLVRLVQGDGRGLRTISDTCALALLDIRALPDGPLWDSIRLALPPRRVTTDIRILDTFFRRVKGPGYFL